MQISNFLKMLIVGIFLFFPFVAVADADKFSAREAITQLPLPEVEFLNAEGEEIQLKDFLGKKIVLFSVGYINFIEFLVSPKQSSLNFGNAL